MNSHVQETVLLLALKAAIEILTEHTYSSVSKFYPIFLDPEKHELDTNLHATHLYALMIEDIPPKALLSIMMPKLQPFLSSAYASDELFYSAENCVRRIMKRLEENRNISQVIHLEYDEAYFKIPKLDIEEKPQVIKKIILKRILKDVHPQINWLKNQFGFDKNANNKDLMN